MTHMKEFRKQIFARGTNWFLVALLTIALALTGCTAEWSPAESVEYVFDDLGRLVAINGTPQRIVSLAPSNTEILFALGLGDKVVGVTDYCDYPTEALEREKVGGPYTPDAERIVALQPDLVLADSINPIDVINSLEELGVTVFAIEATDLDDLLDDIRTVGEVTNQEAEAQALTAEMQTRIDAVTDETAGLLPDEQPRTLHIMWHDPIWTAGQDTFIDDVIELAGGVNIFYDLEGYQTVDIESVIVRDPEVILVTAMGGTGGDTWGWVMNETKLAEVSARQNGRVYYVESNWIERAGPRIVLGLELAAKCIHPEIFEEPED